MCKKQDKTWLATKFLKISVTIAFIPYKKRISKTLAIHVYNRNNIMITLCEVNFIFYIKIAEKKGVGN